MTSRSDSIGSIASAILALCAMLVTGLVVRREFFSPAARPSDTTLDAEEIRDWRQLAAEGHGRGSSNAAVFIVEFSDFQCPACRGFALTLDSLRRRYPQDLRTVYRHLPLEAIHPAAGVAARASECAALQGQFDAFHDLLFSVQDSLGQLPWNVLAARGAVQDTVRFGQCLTDRSGKSSAQARLAADSAVAQRLQLNATPTVVVNNHIYRRALPLPTLDSLVRSLIVENAARDR